MREKDHVISKLLTLLGAAKGAAVATVVVLSAATAVAVSSPKVRDTVEQAVSAVSGQASQTSDAAKTAKDGSCAQGQPAVVAQRNAADKLLRASFQTHQKALQDLRGKDVDNQAAGPIVKKADDDLKDTLTKALNAVASNTLGREGQNKDTASGSAKPSASPKPSGSPAASCAPESSSSPKASASPKADGSAKPSEQGRVVVAARTTLDAANQAIVDKAIADMDATVKAAQAAVAALPSPVHGKPSGEPGSNGNKPSDAGKPATVPGGGKPSESPKR